MRHLTLNFDGSCWPNPGGTAAYGYFLSENNLELESGHGVITNFGETTSNNVAEFFSLYKGLESVSRYLKESGLVSVKGDSNLVIQMMTKRWKAKGGLYYSSYLLAKNELKSLRMSGITVTFDWIPRELNQKCDDLSKKHLDKS